MCGFVALFGPLATAANLAPALSSLRHRGPDAQGTWFDAPAGLALGHCRLSILDLSPAGAQPMRSADNRYVLAFNGEIYNWRELRHDLETRGVVFRGNSDTEVLVEGIAAWGLADCLTRCVGMFALACFDARERRLLIARDRFGEKPLYYGRLGRTWIAASELKALRALPGFDAGLDAEAAALYFRYGYVPQPHSIYAGVGKLTPGSWAELRDHGGETAARYWDFAAVVERGLADPYQGSEDDAADELGQRLDRIVALQSVADVPVGAFLSGGVDSSAVLSALRRDRSEGLLTFSIGFDEPGFDESGHAAAVAKALGTRHTERIVSPADALAVIPDLSRIYDEPFGDSSAVPTLLLSRLARERVVVALTGDAGDEVFGGYPRYLALAKSWARLGRIPTPLSRAASGVFAAAAATLGLAGCASMGAKAEAWAGAWARRFAVRAGWHAVGSLPELHRLTVARWLDPGAILLEGTAPDDPLKRFSATTPCSYAMAADTLEYLPGDILAKVDRAAMAASLETRLPFLDHTLVAWAWRLPEAYKIAPGIPGAPGVPDATGGSATKRVLRRLLYRRVPRALVERPKQGFALPLGAWLRGPLRPWAESLLDPALLARQGLIRVKAARNLWHEHLHGPLDLSYPLWTLLMFQAWRTRD